MIQKIKNVLRAVLQQRGSTTQKRNLWNNEFASGTWDYIDRTPDDCIYGFLRRYCHRGDILDLGCGSGNTGNELEAAAYNRYTGVDISTVAIQKAVQRSQQCHRSAKNSYYVAEIADYVPDSKYNVILFRESIFYVPRGEITEMLRHYKQFLTPTGVFIVRMYDRDKYAGIIHEITENFQLLETFNPDKVATTVVIFR